jgi:hypothetical protein
MDGHLQQQFGYPGGEETFVMNQARWLKIATRSFDLMPTPVLSCSAADAMGARILVSGSDAAAAAPHQEHVNPHPSTSVSPPLEWLPPTAATKSARIIFPQHLFRMMKDIDTRQENLSHIVSWHHSGLKFVIHKPDEFVTEVMPIYFGGQSKLTSFHRQLRNYGFLQDQNKENSGSITYFHKNFRRDKPVLLQGVVLESGDFFPQRLFRMMEDIEKRQAHLSHIVSWHHSGLKFVIHKVDAFVSEVVPIYFRSHCNTFHRQLKNYGFCQDQDQKKYGFRPYQNNKKNIDGLIYYHENFRKDKPSLLQSILLKSSQTKKKKRALSKVGKTPECA